MGLFDFFYRKEKEGQGTEAQTGMFTDLIMNQKMAMFSLMANLAAAPTERERQEVVQKMLMSSASQMGLTMPQIVGFMQSGKKMSEAEILSNVRTIKDEGIMQWLIYTAYGIIAVNQNSQALNKFLSWFNQLGYSESYIKSTIDKIEAIGNFMNQK